MTNCVGWLLSGRYVLKFWRHECFPQCASIYHKWLLIANKISETNPLGGEKPAMKVPWSGEECRFSPLDWSARDPECCDWMTTDCSCSTDQSSQCAVWKKALVHASASKGKVTGSLERYTGIHVSSQVPQEHGRHGEGPLTERADIMLQSSL